MANIGPAALVITFSRPVKIPAIGDANRADPGETVNSTRRRLESTNIRTIAPRHKFRTQSGRVTRILVPAKTPNTVRASNQANRFKTEYGKPPRKTYAISITMFGLIRIVTAGRLSTN